MKVKVKKKEESRKGAKTPRERSEERRVDRINRIYRIVEGKAQSKRKTKRKGGVSMAEDQQGQKLFVKVKDLEGVESQKEIHVHCFWSDLKLGTIYLHTNGIYGYKDGAPVKSKKELEDLIQQPTQLKYALLWWEKVGARLSEEFYKRKAEEEEGRVKGTLAREGLGELGHLDMIQYQRRSLKDRSEKAYSEPGSWSMWFQARPDWWGYARTIEIGDSYFRRSDPGSPEGKEE